MPNDNFDCEDHTPCTEAEVFDDYAEATWRKIQKSGNPMYVWEVIARATKDDGIQMPLPDWCRWYLADVAKGMMKHADQHTKVAKGTAATVPDILFMSKPGWNAFKDYKSDKRREKLALSQFLLRASGASSLATAAALTKLSGVYSSRALHRLLAEGKKARKRTRVTPP